MREMKLTQSPHVLDTARERIWGQQGDIRRGGRRGLKKSRDIHGAGGDAKLRMTAESAGEQLRLQAIGIDDEDANGVRSG